MCIKIKQGMKGSNSGRSRYMGTEELKHLSKKLRRKESKNTIKESL